MIRTKNLFIEFTKDDGIQYTYENIEQTSQGYMLMTDLSGISMFGSFVSYC
jgi:hypothetical protein